MKLVRNLYSQGSAYGNSVRKFMLLFNCWLPIMALSYVIRETLERVAEAKHVHLVSKGTLGRGVIFSFFRKDYEESNKRSNVRKVTQTKVHGTLFKPPGFQVMPFIFPVFFLPSRFSGTKFGRVHSLKLNIPHSPMCLNIWFSASIVVLRSLWNLLRGKAGLVQERHRVGRASIYRWWPHLVLLPDPGIYKQAVLQVLASID